MRQEMYAENRPRQTPDTTAQTCDRSPSQTCAQAAEQSPSQRSPYRRSIVKSACLSPSVLCS